MTLSDLAALAAKVEGFVRPLKYCDECDDPMDFPGKVRDEYGQTRTCGWCDGTGTLFDNSPAALAMAVHECCFRRNAWVSSREWRGKAEFVILGVELRTGSCVVASVAPEDISRALLTALLRAHGVEVADA